MNLQWYKQLPCLQVPLQDILVLFVCTGNTCRSPAAEFYVNQLANTWQTNIHAFSRGTTVAFHQSRLKDEGKSPEEIQRFFMTAKESRKVIGEKKTDVLLRHTGTQITQKDLHKATIVLTMEKDHRDELKKRFSSYSNKIFTLREFVDQKNHRSSSNDLDIPNPFSLDIRLGNISEGDKKYYLQLKQYQESIQLIETLCRRLTEILYLLQTKQSEAQ